MEALGPGGGAGTGGDGGGTGVDGGATAANGFSWTGLDVQAAARSTAAIPTIVVELTLMIEKTLQNVRRREAESDVCLSGYRVRSVVGTHLFIEWGPSIGRTCASRAGAASLARP